MEKEKADPEATPIPSEKEEPFFPSFLEHLSLEERKDSIAGTESDEVKERIKEGKEKTKRIDKKFPLKRSYKKREPLGKKENYKLKCKSLESKINDLESDIDRMRRKMECCPDCRYYAHAKEDFHLIEAFRPNYEEEMKKIAGSLNDSRGSMGSVEFENVEFHAPKILEKEMDDKIWVYLGTLMIAMGSKNLEFDGNINIFRILKESVDTLRRQVEKSQPDINLDFYETQEEMKETNFMEDIGFDPFTEKISGENGLGLEGIKIESVEQFELIYDSKSTYNIKYEALLGAMEYLRENSWLTF